MAFKRVGYGQVEPNQLSAQKTGQIYASLPLDTEVKVLQNGEFMFYDYATEKVTADDSTGVAEPMLVFNEIKLYEPFWRRSYKDFAMIRVGDNYVTSDLAVNGPVEGRYGDGAETTGINANPGHTEYPYRMDGIAPRLFKTNIGDIFTTNMVKTGDDVTYAVGDKLVPVKNADSKTLVLEANNAATDGMIWVVVKVYTMPDGQDAVKLQRVH
jgi:hypothetical protein